MNLSQDWLLSQFDQRLLPLMQFAASTMLTLAGFIVAVAALNFGYRNNFGWRPIVLLKSYGIGSGSGWQEVHCAFEVWNRRKYAVVVREMQVSFGRLRVDHEIRNTEGEETSWFATDHGELVWTKKVSIGPGEHCDFEAVGPIGVQALLTATDRIEVWVDVFDPRKNGHIVIRAKSEGFSETWWRLQKWLRRKRRLPGYMTTQPVRRRGRTFNR